MRTSRGRPCRARRLRRLTTAVVARRSLSLVYRREAKVSAEVRAVIDFVVVAMQETAARIEGASYA